MSKTEAIKQFMLETMEEFTVEPTPENCLMFLTQVQDAWREDMKHDKDPGTRLEKTFYRLALNNLIAHYQFKIMFPRIMA